MVIEWSLNGKRWDLHEDFFLVGYDLKWRLDSSQSDLMCTKESLRFLRMTWNMTSSRWLAKNERWYLSYLSGKNIKKNTFFHQYVFWFNDRPRFYWPFFWLPDIATESWNDGECHWVFREIFSATEVETKGDIFNIGISTLLSLSGWWFGTWIWCVQKQLGVSSSQCTFSYFSEGWVAQPPTSSVFSWASRGQATVDQRPFFSTGRGDGHYEICVEFIVISPVNHHVTKHINVELPVLLNQILETTWF